MTAHARLGASSAHRILACPGSLALSIGAPRTSSKYADWGTDAHELSALCLEGPANPGAFMGKVMPLGNVVDKEMAECVQTYIDNVREYVGRGGQLFVEQKVSYAHVTDVYKDEDGNEDSFGTADAVIISGDGLELQVHDLKTGMTPVSAEHNAQLSLYALGALNMFGLAGDFERVRLVIHQPRISPQPFEWDCSVEELEAFGKEANNRFHEALHGIISEAGRIFNPGEKQCQFCPAKGNCPAQDAAIAKAVAGDFAHLTEEGVAEGVNDLQYVFSDALAKKMNVVGMVEDWCKAVRARVESELLSGRKVPGYKIVEGRLGNRSWANAAEAEELLKSMRLKVEDMYNLSLISPTTAENLTKSGTIGPRQWTKVEALITRKPGKASVAPESDKRPTLNTADDFASLADTSAHPFRA